MESVELYAVVAFGVVAILQIFYQSFFMLRMRGRKEFSDKRPPLSIVVCARNEGGNISRLIDSLMQQKYPEFQVVVVDDCSTDDTLMQLAEAHQRYPQLYYTSIPIDNHFKHGKKLAVTVGIKAAKYQHLVMTDADCVPSSDRWLESIAQAYTEGKQLVIGYGKYRKIGGLLNYIIRYEAFWNAVQYFGFAVAFRPFMGVGRNMSYKRELYDASSKYRCNIKVLSGDDDLFISEMGTRANTSIVFSADSQTVSEPKHTWSQWVAQKARHLQTASYYPKSVSSILMLEQITRQLTIWGGVVLLICMPNVIILSSVASALFVREVLIYISLYRAQKLMGERGLWGAAIIMDTLLPWIQLLAWICGQSTKKNTKWR